MNPRVLILIAAGFALAGCPDKPAEKPAAPPPPKVAAAPPPPTAAAPATAAKAATGCKGNCPVTVKVTKSGGTCTITEISPEHLAIDRDPTPTNIRWEIDGDNSLKFDTPNGISFDKPAGPPPANVMAQNGQGGARSVTMTDRHVDDSTKGSWGYTVFVTDGTAKCRKDPSVDNN